MSKTAIITGGVRGIGKGIAMRLAEKGYDVVVNYVSDRSSTTAAELTKEISSKYGVKAIAVQGNVSKYEDCKKIVDAAVNEFGPHIEVLVNNAGIEKSGPFLEKTPEEYTNVISVNLLSPIHCAHLVLPYMVEKKAGVIINVGSIASFMALPDDIDYTASKSGILGLTRSLAMLGAQNNIRVNAVAPGLINTDMLANAPEEARQAVVDSVPLGKIGEVKDIVDCVEYLIDAEYVTGQCISPNGGLVMD